MNLNSLDRDNEKDKSVTAMKLIRQQENKPEVVYEQCKLDFKDDNTDDDDSVPYTINDGENDDKYASCLNCVHKSSNAEYCNKVKEVIYDSSLYAFGCNHFYNKVKFKNR